MPWFPIIEILEVGIHLWLMEASIFIIQTIALSKSGRTPRALAALSSLEVCHARVFFAALALKLQQYMIVHDCQHARPHASEASLDKCPSDLGRIWELIPSHWNFKIKTMKGVHFQVEHCQKESLSYVAAFWPWECKNVWVSWNPWKVIRLQLWGKNVAS